MTWVQISVSLSVRWLKASGDGTGAKVKLKAVLQKKDAIEVSPKQVTTPNEYEATPTSPSGEERSLTSQYMSQLRGEQSSSVDKSHDSEC